MDINKYDNTSQEDHYEEESELLEAMEEADLSSSEEEYSDMTSADEDISETQASESTDNIETEIEIDEEDEIEIGEEDEYTQHSIPEIKSIKVKEIIIKDGRRNLDLTIVKALEESIKTVGLMNPITVCLENEKYILITGAHRLQAHKNLNWEYIASIVTNNGSSVLREIDENLIRNNLTALERSVALMQRKKILGKGFSKKISEALKKGRSTIDEEIKIATDLDDEVIELLIDKPIANKKGDLKLLAKQDRDTQKEIAQAIINEEVTSVKQYLEDLDENTFEASADNQTLADGVEERASDEDNAYASENTISEAQESEVERLKARIGQLEKQICGWHLSETEVGWKALKDIGDSKRIINLGHSYSLESFMETIQAWETRHFHCDV